MLTRTIAVKHVNQSPWPSAERPGGGLVSQDTGKAGTRPAPRASRVGWEEPPEIPSDHAGGCQCEDRLRH